MLIDLNGTWSGHFKYDPSAEGMPKDNQPIVAEFVVSGEQLTGTMREGKPSREQPYRDFFALHSAIMKPYIRFQNRIFVLLHPNAIIRITLPEMSKCSGTSVGDQIKFVKVYDGQGKVTFITRGAEVSSTRTDLHPIHYVGRIKGNVIEGTWSIQVEGKTETGRFRLRKDLVHGR